MCFHIGEINMAITNNVESIDSENIEALDELFNKDKDRTVLIESKNIYEDHKFVSKRDYVYISLLILAIAFGGWYYNKYNTYKQHMSYVNYIPTTVKQIYKVKSEACLKRDNRERVVICDIISKTIQQAVKFDKDQAIILQLPEGRM